MKACATGGGLRRASSRGRGAGIFKHLAQPGAAALEVGDLALDGCQPPALHLGRLRTGRRAFDQPHAVGKPADFRQREAGSDQALDLPDLRDGGGGKGAIPVVRPARCKQALVVVVAQRTQACARFAGKLAD